MIAGGAMKRSTLFLVVLALAGFSTAAEASEWQKSLKSRWLGAWVVTTTEGYSDCNGTYTNNRINGNLVKSSGRQVFEAGELAKLDRVDAKRSRLDLHLSLIEPVLLDHPERWLLWPISNLSLVLLVIRTRVPLIRRSMMNCIRMASLP